MRAFIKNLAIEAETIAIGTYLFDSDTIIFTMSDGSDIYKFSRGFNSQYGFDENGYPLPESSINPSDQELREDFPDHVWLSLLAFEYTLSDVAREIDRYKQSKERPEADWDALYKDPKLMEEELSHHVSAFDLQMSLSKLMGCNWRLTNLDYDHASDLDFSEDYLQGYSILQMRFRNKEE